MFSVGFLSLVACAGCAEDQATLEGAVVANATSALALAPAEAAAQAATAPAPTPTPPVTNALPATIAATNTVAAPAASTNSSVATKPVMGPVEAPALSPAMTELVRLLQAGVSPEVLSAFITNSATPFYVGSAEIVYLRDLGAPPSILATLIHHDATPEIAALKQAASAVKPLPPGIALSTPATNVFPQRPAPAAVPNPPEPMPVNPGEGAATYAPPPPVDTVVYEVPVETQPVSYSYFYSSLAPYGAWADVPGYGYCWRPTVSVYNPSWRPYCDDGRWLWSDRGWYWYSGYSWGWAPFHYGRWAQPAGYGWVWQPDTCWGPSWVSWRYSAGYCGWAPLPPSAYWATGVGFYSGGLSVGIGFDFGLGYGSYVFCPTTRFCDPRPYDHCVPKHQAQSLYKDSTVVNNYVLGNNNTIINNGVGFDKVAKVTRGDIRKVTVRESGVAKDLGPRHERLSPDGGTLTVHRPAVSTLAATGSGATAPASNRRVAGVTGPRTYGETPAGVTSPKAGSISGVGSYSKPGAGATLAPTAPGASSAAYKPGVTGTAKSPAATSYAAPTEPRTIKPIIVRRSEAPILAGGPEPEPSVTAKDPAHSYRPGTTAGTPAPGAYAKPSPVASKPAAATGLASGGVAHSPTTRAPTSPVAVKPATSMAKPSSIGQLPATGAPRITGRTDPASLYSKPTLARSPAAQASAPGYVKPSAGVSPARNYSSPVRSAPASPSYSAPVRSAPAASAPRVSPGYSGSRSGVSAPSRGASRPASAPSSGGGRSVGAPSSGGVGKVGR